MQLEQSQKIEQQLSQKQLQSLNLLQMNALELDHFLEELSMENPVVERVQETGTPEIEEVDRFLAKWQWLENCDVKNRQYSPLDGEDRDPLATSENPGGLEETLKKTLLRQIGRRAVPEPLCSRVQYLVQCLEDDGYLRIPLEQLAAEMKLTEEEAEAALALIQTLEPAGVGARDLAECLVLQLRRQEADPLTLRIAGEFLKELGSGHFRVIEEKTGASQQQIQKVRERLRQLDPKPCSGFYTAPELPYVLPDVILRRTAEGLELEFPRRKETGFNLSEYYCRLYEETDDKEVKQYLGKKLTEARNILYGLEQRKSTLERCTEVILERQKDFFRLGKAGLKPLSLADIAERLDIHVSTVSRTLKNKYLQYPGGMIAFGDLLVHSTAPVSEAGTEGAGSEYLKELIRKLIEAENKEKPLSDQKLCEELCRQKHEISRRTVAKYREELGIPGTSARKKR